MAGSGRQNADPVLIAALAGGATAKEAADLAGVGERTVVRRQGDPAFRQRVEAAQREMLATATTNLAGASVEAVETLRKLLRGSMPPAVKLGASRAILELGAKLREAQELEARIAALEERIEQQGGQRWGRLKSG